MPSKAIAYNSSLQASGLRSHASNEKNLNLIDVLDVNIRLLEAKASQTSNSHNTSELKLLITRCAQTLVNSGWI